MEFMPPRLSASAVGPETQTKACVGRGRGRGRWWILASQWPAEHPERPERILPIFLKFHTAITDHNVLPHHSTAPFSRDIVTRHRRDHQYEWISTSTEHAGHITLMTLITLITLMTFNHETQSRQIKMIISATSSDY
jgi:hypothetical protein